MGTLTVLLTRHSIFNLSSTLIRAALPHSALAFGRSSHAIIVDGDYGIEAKMAWREGWKLKSGVRRVLLSEALVGATVVATIPFTVPDAEAGLQWARTQVGKPYDFMGALGLLVPSDRAWQADSDWWCYELAARAVHEAGRPVFAALGHITGRELAGVNPFQK